MGKPRALFLIATDYDSLVQKGVTWILKASDENGFLERVITVHPFATQERVVDVNAVHRIYEFKEKFLPFCSRSKVLRYPHHVFHFLRLIRTITRTMDQERIDFVRAFEPTITGLLAWMVTRVRRKPFCISIHADFDKRFQLDASQGSPTFLGSRSLARKMEHFVLSRADLVLPIRDSLADKVVQQGISRDKIRVIPHGVDLAPFRQTSSLRVREELGIAKNLSILSFAGRLSPENYVDDILQLAAKLRQQRSDFVIVMAGDGPSRAAMENKIRQDGLQDVVKLIGSQSRDFVIALRQESQISLCLMGGFSLIEACAAGHLVVAYDVEWHSELVKTQQTGWLVPEKNVTALTEAVVYLLDHPADAAHMGTAAQALAFERHDIQKTSALKCRYYLELLQPTSGQAV